MKTSVPRQSIDSSTDPHGMDATKLGWRIGLGPENTTITFGTNPDKGMNPGTFSFIS